jgi:hypothetical protein
MLKSQYLNAVAQAGHLSLGVYRKEWMGRNSAAIAPHAPTAKATQNDIVAATLTREQPAEFLKPLANAAGTLRGGVELASATVVHYRPSSEVWVDLQ